MKGFNTRSGLLIHAGAILFGFWVSAPLAFAAESAGHWRHTYDEIMMWVNFIILAFLLVKFGRKPLMNFLGGQREELSEQINRIEAEKKEADDNVQQALRELKDSAARLERIKERIVQAGEKRKQAIIEDAHNESRILLEGAKRKIENQLILAKKKYRDEMVDRAMVIVFEKLPREITAKDNQRFLEKFIDSARAE